MSIWAVMAILIGITGFYIFLSLYLAIHLFSKAFRGRRSGSQPELPDQPRLEPLLSRIKEQPARSAESSG